jgi:hypothetical protein
VAGIVLLAHLPLLRLEEEEIDFGGGSLWRLPFETYDQVTLGAFGDHRDAYERTAPVVYRVDAQLEGPAIRHGAGGAGTIEMKLPPYAWPRLAGDLGFLVEFKENLVNRAWCALLLAAPATALPDPSASAIFAVRGEEGVYFQLGDSQGDAVRVQGDADQELFLLSRAAGPPLGRATVERAAEVWDLLPVVGGDRALGAALRALLWTTEPVLSPSEQLTLAVTALEALLLPEVVSGLGATFAQRVSALLGGGELATLARELYDARSASLHGGAPASAERAAALSRDAVAQQLLAGAILALAPAVLDGGDLAEIRDALDDGPIGPAPVPPVPVAEPAGLRPADRMSIPQGGLTTGFFSGAAMDAPEGTVLSWSPLVGLGCEPDALPHRLDGGGALMPGVSTEVVAMEDADIRRDFISQLHLDDRPFVFVATGAKADGHDAEVRETPGLLDRRDLIVTALRIAGFSSFTDPELLGSYVYDGRFRHRRATVLRQTVLMRLQQDPPDALYKPELRRINDAWGLVDSYRTTARHPEVDAMLTLFRRVHDDRFIPPDARAGLMLATLEAMLGRFRRRRERVQLEDLVTVLTGPDSDAGRWFATDGRQLRNSVAHGYWDGDTAPLADLLAILRLAVAALLETWTALPVRSGVRPGRALIDALTARVSA